MPSDLARRMRRYTREAILSLFLGLALGYMAFYLIFPTVSVPAAGESFLAGAMVLLFGCAALAGFLTKDVYAGTVQSFASLPVAFLVAVVLDLAPAFTGAVRGDFVILAFQVATLGFPAFLLGIPINFIGEFVGLGLRDRMAPTLSGPPVSEQK